MTLGGGAVTLDAREKRWGWGTGASGEGREGRGGRQEIQNKTKETDSRHIWIQYPTRERRENGLHIGA